MVTTALLRLFVRGVVRLRYRLHVYGLDAVAARGTRGILFLANHPALIDPVIVMAELYRVFAPRPLADRDQINIGWWARWIARRVGVITMPDPARQRDTASRREVDQALAACAASLRRGENVLVYPAGHICRERHEDLGGASGVESLLRLAPAARVVLVRTEGLWGSMFSRGPGVAPRFSRCLRRGVWAIVLNGIIGSPRRDVTLTLHEPSDLPREAGRRVLNPYLEAFYNAHPARNTYVPHTIWERGGKRSLPEPRPPRLQGDTAEVPSATREQVMARLRELSGVTSISEDDVLARELGLDSLSLVDLAVWLECEFGFSMPEDVVLERVRDVLLAARGNVTATPLTELDRVPPSWFEAGARASAQIPGGASLAEVFLKQARRTPGRVMAADPSGGVRTYRDLITGVYALRPWIARMPGEHVGIMLPASTAAVVVYLAALFAGKTPVMINWTSGVRNIRHALDLLEVRRVLTSARLVDRMETQYGDLDAVRGSFVFLETVQRELPRIRKAWSWIHSRLSWRALRTARVSETAVVLFTSGSEDVPKAVPLTHANLLANIRDVARVFRFTDADRVIGMLPPFHSFGMTCTVLLPLCAGVPTVYHPNPTEGGMLARILAAYRVTLLVGTPTFVRGIVQAARQGELDSVRAAVVGGEACPASLVERITHSWPKLKVLEGYGVTECSPVISVSDEQDARPGTMGRVLPSLQWALQDVDTGRRAAPGRAGILLVRGPSVFSGYLGGSGASPFERFEGRPWYRTGDLVRADADGVLRFVGRLKRFVKLGGEMISLPAIEGVLMSRFGNAEDQGPMLAVESKDRELNPELVLFSVTDLDRETVNRCLREAGLSPLHNIRRVRRVESIPTLGTGKTDYRALRLLLESE